MYLQQKERKLLKLGQSSKVINLKSVLKMFGIIHRYIKKITAKKIPMALLLSSSLNISPMTAAPITGPREAPIVWNSLQNNREGILCAEATPADRITKAGKA